MHIVLIANYVPDGQESMKRFANMLADGLKAQGYSAEVLRPHTILGRLIPRNSIAVKWLGYVDKFLIFPILLAKHAKKTASRHLTLYHICDHSNAMYASPLCKAPCLVTCHDLLAVRSALGDFKENRIGWTGRILQKWILSSLRKRTNIVCVSQATSHDAQRLGIGTPAKIQVIRNGLNFPYRRLQHLESATQIQNLITRTGIQLPSRFLFHIGGNQWYKNREGLIKIYRDLASARKDCPALVIAGKQNSTQVSALIKEAGLREKILNIGNVSHQELNALYSKAEALVFPSLAEGFGWPIIEAQASGCRVITSNRMPMTEIGGDSPLYIAPIASDETISQIISMLDESPEEKESRIQAGLRNAAGFSQEEMIRQYANLYQNLATRS